MIGNKKDFIQLSDFSKKDLRHLLDVGHRIKRVTTNGRRFRPLKGKTLAMIFSKSSTRTRVSFEVGIYQLGGVAVYLNHQDIQLGRGELIRDTGAVLGKYADGIMIRTFSHQDVIELARYCDAPVINGLTDFNHPCQVMSDLMTIEETFGHLNEIKVAFIGDGNNMASSWVFAAKQMGFQLFIASPQGYACKPEIQKTAAGSDIHFVENPAEAVRNAHVVYTDVWASMGQEEDTEKRKHDFRDYCVTAALTQAAQKNFIFMHCLPAHRGEEVTEEIIDGEHSIIYRQAENRLHLQKAVMYLLMSSKKRS